MVPRPRQQMRSRLLWSVRCTRPPQAAAGALVRLAAQARARARRPARGQVGRGGARRLPELVPTPDVLGWLSDSDRWKAVVTVAAREGTPSSCARSPAIGALDGVAVANERAFERDVVRVAALRHVGRGGGHDVHLPPAGSSAPAGARRAVPAPRGPPGTRRANVRTRRPNGLLPGGVDFVRSSTREAKVATRGALAMSSRVTPPAVKALSKRFHSLRGEILSSQSFIRAWTSSATG